MNLKKLRKEIDKIDQDILNLLHRRKSLVERVGLFKKKHGLPIFNSKREKEIYKKINKWAKKRGLRKTFLQKIWSTIIAESKIIQKQIKK